MKKSLLLILAFILVFGCFAALPAAADESELYYINVQILKIFPPQARVLYNLPPCGPQDR